MRSFKELIHDLVYKPPVLFPLVGLFHIFWLIRTIWTMAHEPFDIAWLQVVWMAAYTIAWLGVCDLRRWGAYTYMALTLVNAILFISLRSVYDKDVYTSSLFLIDALFSFFILFYFRRLTNKRA